MKKGLFILFFVIGLGLLAGSVVSIFSSRAFLKIAVSAEGQVTQLIPRYSSSSNSNNASVTYAPEVKFTTAEGQEVLHQSSYSTYPASYQQGETVKVWYDPQNPTKVRLDGFGDSYMGAVILGILGFIFNGFGIIPLLYIARKKRLATELKAHGQKIAGTVSSVEKDGSITMNGKSPYRIYANGGSSLHGAATLFKSDFIWFDPTQWVQQGQPIDIYIDPQNSNRYFVDISFLPTVK